MRAIIIGGGIGGLTAAIALRLKGIDAVVYESVPEIHGLGAGISLWPNAVKALRALGLGPALDRISLPNRDGAMRRSDGAFLSRAPTDVWEKHFGGGVIVLHRAELLDLLTAAVGPANLKLGHACTVIGQNSTGVTAAFANGATARGDILIGADGLHSVVRPTLGHRAPIRYSGYTAWRAVVPFDHAAVIAGETWGCGNRFGMLPIHGGRVYWFATANAPEGEGKSPAGRQSELLSLFASWHPPIEALIRASADSDILRNDIYDREPLSRWGQGRVTLLGDAAHPMTPNLGQGGCQAIEDALELAASLSTAPSPEAGLRTYESRRLDRTKSIVLASRRMGQLGQLTSPFLCALRDTTMRLTPRAITFKSLAKVAAYEGHLAGWKSPGPTSAAES